MEILKFRDFEGQKSRGSRDRKKLKFFVRKIQLKMSKKMIKNVGGHLAQHGEKRPSKSRKVKIPKTRLFAYPVPPGCRKFVGAIYRFLGLKIARNPSELICAGGAVLVLFGPISDFGWSERNLRKRPKKGQKITFWTFQSPERL